MTLKALISTVLLVVTVLTLAAPLFFEPAQACESSCRKTPEKP